MLLDPSFLNSDNQAARIGMSAVSGVLLLLIFVFGRGVWPISSTDCGPAVGCPPGWTFGLVWAALVVLLWFSFYIAASNLDIALVSILFALLALFCIFAYMWLYFNYHDEQSNAMGVVYLSSASLFFYLLSVITYDQNTWSLENNSKFAVTLTAAPGFLWTLYATLLALQQ